MAADRTEAMPTAGNKAPDPVALAAASPRARAVAERLTGESAVTLEQLEQLLPDDLSADEMDDLFVLLGEMGVAIAKSAAQPTGARTAPAARTAGADANANGPEVLADRSSPGPDPQEPPPPPRAAPSRMPGVVTQYLSEISEIPPLSPAEEESLARLAREGDTRAANALVESHLRLVVKICAEYRHTGLARMDLIQAGNVGLMDAAHHFSPGRGGRFAHFASWWIRQAIRAHVEAAGLFIRLPRKLVKEMHALARQRSRLRGSLKREATDEEAAESLGWPVSKVAYLGGLGHDPLSLDAPLPNDKEKSFEEIVIDPRAPEQVRATRKRHVIASLRPHLERLSAAQRSVLTLRYGLSDQVEHTVHEVSAMTSLSRDEVRRLEKEGLRMLADLSMAGMEEPFGDDD